MVILKSLKLSIGDILHTKELHAHIVTDINEMYVYNMFVHSLILEDMISFYVSVWLLCQHFTCSACFNLKENNFLVACGDRDQSSIDSVRKHIEDGVDVAALTEGGESALHLACIWNHPEKISLLLHAGVDPNVRASKLRSSLDMTPLTWCVYANHIDSVNLFIKNPRTIVNSIVRQENDDYITALDIAEKIGSAAMSEILTKAGAKRYQELKDSLHDITALLPLDTETIFSSEEF